MGKGAANGGAPKGGGMPGTGGNPGGGGNILGGMNGGGGKPAPGGAPGGRKGGGPFGNPNGGGTTGGAPSGGGSPPTDGGGFVMSSPTPFLDPCFSTAFDPPFVAAGVGCGFVELPLRCPGDESFGELSGAEPLITVNSCFLFYSIFIFL